MVLGSAIHTIILEPHLFDQEFISTESKPPNKGEGAKARREDWECRNAHKTQLKPEILEQVCSARDAFYEHPVASHLLEGAHIENSFIWQDPQFGILCKTRPDFIRIDRRTAYDLKTIEDCSDNEEVSRYILKFGCHIQGAMGLFGINQWLPKEFQIHSWTLVFIEKKPPYGIRFIELDETSLEIGWNVYETALETLNRYRQEHEEMGYSSEVETLGLPYWYVRKFYND